MLAAVLILAPTGPTPDDGTRWVLSREAQRLEARHTRHREVFGKGMRGWNLAVLSGIDRVQSTAPKGGGYFANPAALPLESPVGYPLRLWGEELFVPERRTSFCSGATYAALIEAVGFLFPENPGAGPEVFESLRQHEVGGGRREDQVGFWGVWNGESAGLWHALGPLTGMGRRVPPHQLRPGDFLHVFWNRVRGHSTIFLGWTSSGGLRVWSSQKSTNGFGDLTIAPGRYSRLVGVRLVEPLGLLTARPGVYPAPEDLLDP
jgi:hypothetical protein